MTTDMALGGGVLAVAPDQDEWTDEQRTALMFLFGGDKQPSKTEARIFLHVCQRVGLDPFIRQIYLVPYQNRWVVQTGIDGFRTIAARTREHEGTVGPWWCGPDGVWLDVWLDEKPPAAAKVGVLRSGFREPAFGVVTWKEFGKTSPTWKGMGSHMLSKCAEAHALRKAFPQDLAGLYTDDEMPEADLTAGAEHAHGALVHAHPHGERAHDHAELAQPKPAPDFDPTADLARFAPAEDWTVHCGVTGKRRNPKQAAADRLLAALQSGHPGVSDPRSVIDGIVVNDPPIDPTTGGGDQGAHSVPALPVVAPFAPCPVCGCDHADGWPGACNVCGCEPCPPEEKTTEPVPEGGDGTDGGNPLVSDDEQADPASEVTLEPTHDEQGEPVLPADPPVVDVSTGEAARTTESVLADIDQAAEILETSRSKLLIRLTLAHRCNPEEIPVDALLAFLDGIMPEVERKITSQGASA